MFGDSAFDYYTPAEKRAAAERAEEGTQALRRAESDVEVINRVYGTRVQPPFGYGHNAVHVLLDDLHRIAEHARRVEGGTDGEV